MTTIHAADAVDEATRAALAELLLAMADDEFVLGFWDSEWTGIAPLLEEDVAISSLAQDELGHAQALYGLLAELTGQDPDRIAFGREPDAYRHARLLDHPRTDWAFTIARRCFYDTADVARLDALAGSAYAPLAGLVGKLRREERYHLMHVHAWMERLARGPEEARSRLVAAVERLWPDARTVLAPLDAERQLLQAGILALPFDEIEQRWLAELSPLFGELGLPFPFRLAGDRFEPTFEEPGASARADHSDDFRWLWSEFTSVSRSEPGATW